ncbi:hypothetical protein GHT06_016147 [Daphnia sinensis]|uniref:Uncharacterized protein n=1 Tax=Daphnia sinensis TaxID=1820382 RepID=A0AAD5LBV4_9CRUS|nr:hypothetical protein GHT06_016147 [Daphnia sinensis]
MDRDQGGLVRRQVRADLTVETVLGTHTPGFHYLVDKGKSLSVRCLRRPKANLGQWRLPHLMAVTMRQDSAARP